MLSSGPLVTVLCTLDVGNAEMRWQRYIIIVMPLETHGLDTFELGHIFRIQPPPSKHVTTRGKVLCDFPELEMEVDGRKVTSLSTPPIHCFLNASPFRMYGAGSNHEAHVFSG